VAVIVKVADCPALTVRAFGEDSTPRVVRSPQAENSEVFPSASVAVAVRTVPVMPAKDVATVPFPDASVVRLAVPRCVSPSPNPVGSQEVFEKKSKV
jgi:hypothetical protein